MREYKIAAIPADGIGPEVIAADLQAVEALQQRCGDFKLSVHHFDWGSDYYEAHGRMMPEDGVAQLKPFDAILFGSVGSPDVPDHVTLWGLRLPICQGFDQYANVRPTRNTGRGRKRNHAGGHGRGLPGDPRLQRLTGRNRP